MLLRRLVLAVMALGGCLAGGCKGSAAFCVYDYDCSDTEVCGASKRCETRTIESPPPCSTTTECDQGRVCVHGACRYAPPCLNLAGPYAAWRADVADAGYGLALRLNQALGSCAVSTDVTDAGMALPVQGTLDPLGAFANTLPDGGCDLALAGDETLKATCPVQGSTFVFHVYSTASGTNRFTPTRCTPGLVPCNGYRCDSSVAGGTCQSPLVPCDFNSIGIPQCTGTLP